MNSKKRGFYYHFAQVLLKEIKKHNINRANLPRDVNIKQFWKHNVVLISTINQTFNKGIILDEWREIQEISIGILFQKTLIISVLKS